MFGIFCFFILLATLFLSLTGCALTEPPIQHDAPEDIIKKDNIEMFMKSFIINTEFELRYVTFSDTNSMIPTLDYGHHAVEMICPCKVKQGDLISYKARNRTLLHRITDINRDQVYAKGDNTIKGEWINQTDILGKVIAIIY